MASMKEKESNIWTQGHIISTFNRIYKVDSYEEKIESLVNEVAEHKEEIAKLRSTIQGMTK